MRIFISGASGFLGFHLIGEVVRSLPEAELICQYRTEPLEMGGVDVHWVKLNLDDPEHFAKYIESVRPDVIFHMAAMTKVDECEANRKLAELVNYAATVRIAEAARKLGSRIIFTSTDLVYTGHGPHVESEVCRPRHYYGRVKLEAEQAVIASGADCVIARMSNLFGPALARHRTFTKWIEGRISQGERVPLYVDQLRSFLYAPEAARALLLLAESGKSGEIYNVGGPDALSRTEFGSLFFRAFNYDERLIEPISIRDDPKAALVDADCSMDVSKLKALGFEPMSVEQALERWRKTERALGDEV